MARHVVQAADLTRRRRVRTLAPAVENGASLGERLKSRDDERTGRLQVNRRPFRAANPSPPEHREWSEIPVITLDVTNVSRNLPER